VRGVVESGHVTVPVVVSDDAGESDHGPVVGPADSGDDLVEGEPDVADGDEGDSWVGW
jgi:hypothetical protein